MNDSTFYCPLTGLPAEHITESRTSLYSYSLNLEGKQHLISLSVMDNGYWQDNDDLIKNRYIIKGLIYNGKWPFEDQELIKPDDYEESIINAIIPRTQQEKLNALLLAISKMPNFDGQLISLTSEDINRLVLECYFIGLDQYSFYLLALFERNYLKEETHGIVLSIQGLERLIEIKEEGANSKRCFIAMSFNIDQKETRDSIKKAISETGYEPILVDEIHHPSDLTINDAMIAEIKKCKFLVADFTQQKHGVYFEAGFALGRGKPVIYCCKKTEFEKAHFDTNHYPHILYENKDELYHGLKAKIEAWIE